MAAQHGDFFAVFAVPETNGVGPFLGRGSDPLAIRTVSQTTYSFRVSQNGQSATRNRVTQVHEFPGAHGHPPAIGAKGDWNGALLPIRQEGDLLAGGGVQQATCDRPTIPSIGGNPTTVRVVSHEGVTVQVGWGDFGLEKDRLLARRRVPEADGLVVAAGRNLLAVRTERHGCRRSRMPAEDGLEPAGGHVVKVNLVMVEAADRDLLARRAKDQR